MPNYRRARNAGATYFFTVVTAQRRALLASADAVATLRRSLAEVRRQMPFAIDAWVVMPEHMHAIWTLPAEDCDFSTRWGRIKAAFTRRAGLAHVSAPGRDSGLWQPRFWEHLIRDDTDFAAHMDYLHYNPVKHGHVAHVIDWPYSSFHRCVSEGVYAADWGIEEPRALPAARFGE
jgi:putative transposase